MRQLEAIPFAGVIYAHQLHVTIGHCIRDLELLAVAGEPEDSRTASTSYPSAEAGAGAGTRTDGWAIRAEPQAARGPTVNEL